MASAKLVEAASVKILGEVDTSDADLQLLLIRGRQLLRTKNPRKVG